MKFDSVKIPLLLILLLAAGLRFYNYAAWSLSNDELSAIHRAGFSTPGLWIGSGSEALDGHPIGVQAFLFVWMKIFGNSAALVRLPFVLLGIASVFLVFRIGQKWFSSATGLFAALLVSVSGFFILFSQLARPYSPGLFFSLLFVWYWTRFVFPDNKNSLPSRATRIGFVLSAMACMYIHYFSFLFAIMVGFTGFIFVPRQNLLKYVLCGIASAVLFLPHVPYTLEQLSVGGLDWLPKPDTDILWTHIIQGLNDSDWMLFPIAGLFLTGFIFYYRSWRFTRFHLISLLWFLIPFSIAYFYSIYVKSVFQHSVLIYSFPFLIFYLCSYFPRTENEEIISNKKIHLALLLLASFGLISLTKDLKFYEKQHFGVFRELAETTLEWEKEFGEKNITYSININHPSYIDYYLNRLEKKIPFSIYSINSGEELGQLKQIVDSAKSPYFLYAWSTVSDLPETDAIIRSRFPKVVRSKKYFNSEITLYSSLEKDESKAPYFSFEQDFEKQGLLDNDSIMRKKGIARSGLYSAYLDSTKEYSPTFVRRLGKIRPRLDSILVHASAWVMIPEGKTSAEFVISFESTNSTYVWHSTHLDDQEITPGKWTQIFVAYKIPKLPSSEDIVKVYLWNAKKNNFYFDDFRFDVVDE